MDYVSGKVLVEGNVDEKLDFVSLIKIMISYVVGQVFKVDKIKFIDMVMVGKDVWVMGNLVLCGLLVMFFKLGDQVLVVDLNKGVIIQFGNDVCIVLVDYVVGSQELFIGLMNGYVKKLGLINIIFQMVYGLDVLGQFSIVCDMVLLGKVLIYDVLEEYVIYKEKEFIFNKICQFNCNCLLWSSNLNVDGMKIGIMVGVGYNLVVLVIQGDMCLIFVVLGVKIDCICFNEFEKLLIWGFCFFEIVMLIKFDVIFVIQCVWFGDKSEVNFGVGEVGLVIILCGQLKNLKVSYMLMELQFIVLLKKGQVVGIIDFQFNGKFIEQCLLIVMENVEEGGFFGWVWDFVMMKFYQWFGSWFF